VARRGRTRLIEEQFFFITTTLVRWARVFAEAKYCDLLVQNINHYQERYKFGILGYVIMPSHFHWILHVRPGRETVSDIMRDIKKYSAWDIMGQIENDRNWAFADLFRSEAAVVRSQQRKFWQGRFDDKVIRDQAMLLATLTYIHDNPVSAGLVHEAEQYKYSSARNYLLGDHSVLHVDTSFAGPPQTNGAGIP
jgi:putative transposase